MSESTRKWICRAMFLGMCVLPTLVLGAWSAWAHAERSKAERLAAWQEWIRRELGMSSSVVAIREDRAGKVIFQGLELDDPETQQCIVAARSAQLTKAGERGWLLEVAYPHMPADQILRLWAPLRDRLCYTRGGADWSGALFAHHVTLARSDGPRTLSEADCHFAGSESGALAKIRFLVDGLNMTECANIEVTRRRDRGAPYFVVTLETGPTFLPCSLFADTLPPLRHLGNRCRFQGMLRIESTDSEWRCDALEGTLEGVDFYRLVTELFPHHLVTGEGTIRIARAQFRSGRLIAADGEILLPNGFVSRSLLEAAAAYLPCRVRPDVLSGAEERIALRELQWAFHMDELGLRIQSAPHEAGVLAGTADGPVMWEQDDVVPVINVIRWLVPDSRHHVPATRQTHWLAAVLPIPDLAPGAPATRVSNPPVRLGSRDRAE